MKDIKIECSLLLKHDILVGVKLQAQNSTAQEFCMTFIQNCYEDNGAFGFEDDHAETDVFFFTNPHFGTIRFHMPKDHHKSMMKWILNYDNVYQYKESLSSLLLTKEKEQVWNNDVQMLPVI